MTISLVEPYCPVKSATVVKWMMPSMSFGGSVTMEGSQEFAGMIGADVDALDLDRTRHDEPEPPGSGPRPIRW